MLKTRVMPCLLLRNRGLVKTVKFKDPKYLGDPVNTVRIYNDQEVDELVFLDITATPENKKINFDLIGDIASEVFMPFAYGGGVTTIADMTTLYSLGVEKVCLNTAAHTKPELIREAADRFGSQSVVVSVDVKKNWLGRYEVVIRGGREKTGLDPVAHCRRMAELGAGEILLTSVDRDGTMEGYDLELVRSVANAVQIPVVACGGAGSTEDLGKARREGGASAVAAGSLFVYQNRNRSVLINFPRQAELKRVLGE